MVTAKLSRFDFRSKEGHDPNKPIKARLIHALKELLKFDVVLKRAENDFVSDFR